MREVASPPHIERGIKGLALIKGDDYPRVLYNQLI